MLNSHIKAKTNEDFLIKAIKILINLILINRPF